MSTIAITTNGIGSDLKVLEVKEHPRTLNTTKKIMTRQLKSEGFIPEKIYVGPQWYLSGDNPIWLLRQKPCRRFRRGTPSGKDDIRYVFLLDAYKYTAYRSEINALKP